MNALSDFVTRVLRAEGIGRGELVRRMGWRNVAKGVRRLDDFCDHLALEDLVLPRLLDALPGRAAEVLAAVGAREAEIEAERRAAFVPHIRIPLAGASPTFAALVPGAFLIPTPPEWSKLPVDEVAERLCDRVRTRRAGGLPKQGFFWFHRFERGFVFDGAGRVVDVICGGSLPRYRLFTSGRRLPLAFGPPAPPSR